MGKSVLAKPDGGTIPLKGCWHGTAGHTVYYIFATACSQLVVDSCLGSIFRWRVHSAEAPWGHRVRGSCQGGLSLPWWKNTVAEVLAVLEGLLSRYTEGHLRVCVDWTSLCSRPLILTLLGLNWSSYILLHTNGLNMCSVSIASQAGPQFSLHSLWPTNAW